MYQDNIFQWAHSTVKKRHPEWNQTCPKCGRKSFSPRINILTEKPIDDKNCGICDHKDSCGYKMNYTEWKEKYAPPRERLPWEQWIALQRQREKEAEQIRRQLAQREAERKANSFKPYAETHPPKVHAYLDRMAAQANAPPHQHAYGLPIRHRPIEGTGRCSIPSLPHR